MPINEDAITNLLRSSQDYLKTFDPVSAEDPVMDPTKYSYSDMADLIRTHNPSYNPVDYQGNPLNDDSFVYGYLMDENYPNRLQYASLLQENLFELEDPTKIRPPLSSERYAYTQYLPNLLGAAPSLFAGLLTFTDKIQKAPMMLAEMDYRNLAKNLYNLDVKGVVQDYKDAYKKYSDKYDSGVLMPAMGLETPQGFAQKASVIAGYALKGKPGLDIIEEVYAKRAGDIFDKQMKDPKFRAYQEYIQYLDDPDTKWSEYTPSNYLSYFNSAISSGVTTIGTGAVVGALTKNPMAAMRTAQTMAFLLEGTDQWRSSYEYYLDQGYSPLMASRAAHGNGLMYGMAAYGISAIPAFVFLNKAGKDAVKKKLYNSIMTNSAKYLGKDFTNKALKTTLNNKTLGFLFNRSVQGAAESMEEGLQYTAEVAVELGYKGEEALKDFSRNLEIATTKGGVGGLLLGLGGAGISKTGERLSRYYEKGEQPSEKEVDLDVSERDVVEIPDLDSESLTLAKFIRKKEGLSSSDLDTWAGIKASDLAPGKILNILKEKGSEALTILDTDAETITDRFKQLYPESPEYVSQAEEFLKAKSTTKKVKKPVKQQTGEIKDEADAFLAGLEAMEAEDTELDVAVTLPEYESLSKTALQDEIRSRNKAQEIKIPVTGNKSALVQRLKDNDRDQEVSLEEAEDIAPTFEAQRIFDTDDQGEPIQQELSLEQPVEEAPTKEGPAEVKWQDETDPVLKYQKAPTGMVKKPSGVEVKFNNNDEKEALRLWFEAGQPNMKETKKMLNALPKGKRPKKAFQNIAEFAQLRGKPNDFREINGWFDDVESYFTKQEAPDKSAREMIGEWLDEHGREDSLEAPAETIAKQIGDLVAKGRIELEDLATAVADMTKEEQEQIRTGIANSSKKYADMFTPYTTEGKGKYSKSQQEIEAANDKIVRILYKEGLGAPVEDVGVTDEDIEADFQQIKQGRLGRIADKPLDTEKIITSLKEKYPEVETLVKNILRDEAGTEVSGMSIGAIAAWSRQGAKLDTPPHEYAHVLIRALRNDPIIQKAIKQFKDKNMTDKQAEEQLVQMMGEYYATNTLKGKSKGFISNFKTFLRKFWTRIKKLLGKPAEYVAEQFFERGDMFSTEYLNQADVIFDLIGAVDRDRAKVEAIQAKYQTKLVGTKLKSLDIVQKKYGTKKWDHSVNINDYFMASILKNVGKAERNLFQYIIQSEGLMGAKMPIAEFKNIVMKYIYPVTIERATSKSTTFFPFGQSERMTGIPTEEYGDLTAPGGINYGEYNIKVPFEVIRAHAEFVDNNTFAWFRADESKADPTTLRVNEIQSDLFQKYRNQEVITSMPTRKISMEEVRRLEEANKFMKGLQESDWHKYLTKSVIQWAASQGYSKIQFPTGDTINVIENFQNLDEDIANAKKDIKEIKKQMGPQAIDVAPDPVLQESLDRAQERLDHYLGGKTNASVVRKFYENIATFLRRTRTRNYENITDENGNTWVETILTKEDMDRDVPLYQQIAPDTKAGMNIIAKLDNALNAMMSRSGKKISIGQYVKRLAGMIPDDMAIVFAHWKSTNPLVKKAKIYKGKKKHALNNMYATAEEFNMAFDQVVEELDQGLDAIEYNDKSVIAKNSGNIEWSFLHALGTHITSDEMTELLRAAYLKSKDTSLSPEDAFTKWANEDLYRYTGFKYKDYPATDSGNKKRRNIKQLYVRAASSIKVNNGTLQNDSTNLEFNTSTGELVIKSEVSEWTEETNHSREQNRMYQATNAGSDIIWLNTKDIYKTIGLESGPSVIKNAFTIKENNTLTTKQLELLAEKASKLEYVDDNMYGMVMMGVRGDSGNIMFTPIRSEQLDIASDPAKLKDYWLKKVDEGIITKEQARNFLGFRLQPDGKWKKTKNASQKKWLAAEIARMEAMLNIMPADMINNGAEFMRRSKIASTPVFTSPLMNKFKAVVIAKGNEKKNLVFVDRAGNEAPMVEGIPGMGSRNRTDGASIGGRSFFENFWNAFGADPSRKLSKNVIWDAGKNIAVKHETFMPESGLKIMKKVEGKPSELIAEIDDDGNAFIFDGDKKVSVDMLMTDDEAKYSSYNTLEVFDVQGNEFGLIKYNSKKSNSKFPTQWFNYITDSDLRNQIMDELMPRVKSGIQRLFTMTESNEASPQLIYKFTQSVQSDSPHAVTNTFIEKMKLGLGSHPDGAQMLNKLYKTQIMDRALQLADGNGTYLDIIPDYTGTHAENEVSISIDDADAVLQAYADQFGGTIKEAKEMGIRRLNQWLAEVPVGVLVSRSPIPYIGGVFVGRIKALHDRGGQVVLNSDTVTKRLEGDNDGDAVQLEFLSSGLLDSIDSHLQEAENAGRMQPINLGKLTDKNMEINDLSQVENMYSLMHKFILGSRAISQIANVQVIYGQLGIVFNHAKVGDSFIQLKDMVDSKVDFNEAGIKNTNMEYQLRMWIQAAVDNGKHLLLDKWNYNRDQLIRRIFAVTDGQGNYIREINDDEWSALSEMAFKHLTPNSIRNGRNNKNAYTIETLHEESIGYKTYTDNRHAQLPFESKEGLPIKYGFYNIKAPMEQIAIEFANMWEQNAEPGKINPVMFTEAIYNSVHVQSMRSMQDMKVQDLKDAVKQEENILGELTESAVGFKIMHGYNFANRLWTSKAKNYDLIKKDGKGFVQVLEEFEGTIGAKSWDHNAELLAFTDHWSARFRDLTPIEKAAATYRFLEGFYQYNKDTGEVKQTKNRRVLPPVSINDKFTVLDGKIMAKYLAKYNSLINNTEARQNDPGTFTNYLQLNNLIKKVCR